ncbi:MAG: hypothetical protein KIT72_19665 [Polyangiaceae bacterium]|nr:hypothetical protein [Polyangiaceae bacterium]MCW5792640.1 hypothetical protein [Polyangiaceae bacterium]
MRLGLLGPADGDLARLARAARFLLEVRGIDRAIYLGSDRALDEVVEGWARELVGGDPSDDAVWDRAAACCGSGDPEAIRAFLEAEHARRRLARFEVLPSAGSRTVELLDGKVVVLIHDKAHLDEEDIVAASLLAFGKSPELLLKQVGPRWFLSPGVGGSLILEDQDDGIHLTAYGRRQELVKELPLDLSRGTRLRVQGAD